MDPKDDNFSYVDVTELFVTGEAPGGGSEMTSTFGEIDSPIKNLKAVVLSLDWEITDQTMQSFAEEIDRLEEDWAADKILTALLKILRALGQYIATKKARAHPDSVKLLYSVYNNLEKIVLSKDMPRSQKKEIVADELRKYTKLKEQFDIATSSAAKRRKAEASIPEVEEDKMPAALVVEEMEEQMETEVVGLDMTPSAAETSIPMEEMYEEQPSSLADELQAKMDLGLLAQEGDKTAPPLQTKEIVPELSEEESFHEIDNRLEEFFDEEPAEAERAEAGDEAASREIKAPAVEGVEKETTQPAEEIPAKENIEESVVPLVVSEKAGEAAAVSLEVDSRLDDLFGEGDEIPVPDEPEEQAVSIPLEDKTV
ncbi:MAG: hypothetical protein KAJ45_02650, partial [Desulfobulbaceae bacterium]|nr:hypothetical protein [Desulfobulbaceae bacterium]